MASKWPSTKEQINQIFDEALSQNDRTAAIILGSIVELILQEAIQGRWPPISNSLREDLFEGNGPLATFSSKIDVAFAMGVFGPQTKVDLHSIRWIRNKFAHAMAPLTFQTTEIANRTSQIKSAGDPTQRPSEPISKERWVFSHAALIICVNLLLTLPKVADDPSFSMPGWSPSLP